MSYTGHQPDSIEELRMYPGASTSLHLLNVWNSGGVVANLYFQQKFGLADSIGHVNTEKTNAVLANVVSVLQAGALLGALISAPISGK